MHMVFRMQQRYSKDGQLETESRQQQRLLLRAAAEAAANSSSSSSYMQPRHEIKHLHLSLRILPSSRQIKAKCAMGNLFVKHLRRSQRLPSLAAAGAAACHSLLLQVAGNAEHLH